MKVLLQAYDQSGCGYHRIVEPARAVHQAYSDTVTVLVTFDLDLIQWGDQYIGANTHDADVVVMQRPASEQHLAFLRLARAQGAAVVVEIDDSLSTIPAAHKAYTVVRESRAAEYLAQCAREADYVTTSSAALLAEFGGSEKGTIVPNAIPRRIAELPPAYERRDRATVGWTGAVSTHPYDLQVMGAGLRRALDATAGRFVVWSGAHVAEHTGTDPVVLGWEPDVDTYLKAVGVVLDVGLAPLHDNTFNRAKSWLKPLEYAARGVLPIQSDLVEYTGLSLGLFAWDEADWEVLIGRALTDVDWRRECAARQHQQVLNWHLTEHTAEHWLNAWRIAAERRVGATV